MMLRLHFLTGHHRGQVLEFKGPRKLVLGRSSKTDVQIQDERISRRHCMVHLESGAAQVEDLGSGNGTSLNGTMLKSVTQLVEGDVLKLGSVEIGVVVRAPDAPVLQPSLADSAETREAPGGQPPLPSSPMPCAFCAAPIPVADLGRVMQYKGRYLCDSCSPTFDVPGFQIVQVLGEGAMGTVYQAVDLHRSAQVVAIKSLKRTAISPEDRARFLREVSTITQLSHENIVRVIDHGEVGSYLFYVMEFVEGKSLSREIKTHGPLPMPLTLRIGVQIAKALDHAHRRRIVHRDVKPGNILLQPDGVAKLADFGLAKNMGSSGGSGVTRPGEGLGTLPFMPPEQIENALYADQRSDIYAFGATLHNMLTGRPPFEANSPIKLFKMIHSQGPPRIADFRGDVPAVLLHMVNTCLQKDPDKRYQQVREILKVMEQFLQVAYDGRKTSS